MKACSISFLETIIRKECRIEMKRTTKIRKVMRVVVNVALCLMMVGISGCLSYSHYKYSKRAGAARVLPEGVAAKPGIEINSGHTGRTQ